jgi:hypothetical protein
LAGLCFVEASWKRRDESRGVPLRTGGCGGGWNKSSLLNELGQCGVETAALSQSGENGLYETHNLKVIGSNPIPDLNLSIGLRCTADAFDRRSHRGTQSASTAI